MAPLENLLKVIRHDTPEYVPTGLDGVLREITFDCVEWPSQAGTDAWGVRWDMVDARLGAYPVDSPLENLDALDQFSMPDFSTVPYTACGQAWITASDRSAYALMGRVGETLFERAWMLMGMENLMVAVYEDPDGLRRLLRRIADVRATMIARHIAAGCEAVIFADDYGGQENLLLSPSVWRELVRPELERLYRLCRDAGQIIVHHSCGCIGAILPDLVEMGLDVWHPCQPSNDLEKLKVQFAGRLTFYGGVDSSILDRGTPEEVRAEVRLRIRQLASDGGFIAAPSHGVPYPPANLAAMEDEVRKSGRYGSKEFLALFE